MLNKTQFLCKCYKLHYKYNESIIPKLLVPVSLSATYITKNKFLHEISDIICYSTSIVNYCSFYIDDHLKKVDEWRDEEAEYEEKTDPPKLTLKIKDEKEYILRHFPFFTNLFSNVIIIVIFFQIINLMFSEEKLFALFDFIPDLFIIGF